jgi:hypothetical protein
MSPRLRPLSVLVALSACTTPPDAVPTESDATTATAVRAFTPDGSGFTSRSGDGARVTVDRAGLTASSNGKALTLRFNGYGRDDRVLGRESQPGLGGCDDDGDCRVELDHGGAVEWFVARDRGVEQGWTIAARPAGIGPCVLYTSDAADE